MDIFLQLAIILICLFYGARKGGVALGLLGGAGLVLMVFTFGLKPGKPPVDVMLTIIAVVAASATLQASGGLEVMLKGAEKLLRRNPRYVSITGAVCHLHAHYLVWHRACGVHHAAHHLRHRHQEQHPARAAHGGCLNFSANGHTCQPGISGRGLIGGIFGQGS
jgi:hypothetical protein